jgi:hypothetical protein
MKARSDNDLEELFTDPLLFTPIEHAVMTPQGFTYESMSIIQWLAQSKSDPFNRTQLSSEQLLPNHLFSQIKKLFRQPELDMNRLKDCLTCPLSGQLFKHPVVVKDGYTYERDFIEAYLLNHKHTPSGIRQTITGSQPFVAYPNRFVEAFLQHHFILELLKLSSPDKPLIPERDQTRLMKPVHTYLTKRACEDNYAGSIFGYSKWDKFAACAHLGRAMSGQISVQTFFADHHRKHRKALKQGRLREMAEPAIDYLTRKKVTSL